MKPTVGSLFAGIGGFDLAFEREGYDVAWQVEIDSYCQRVLEKHWPDVPRYDQDTEGFGSRLLRMSVEGQLQGTIERAWDEDGMSVTLDLSLPVLAG